MADADFMLLRQAILIFLDGEHEGAIQVLRESVARVEWKAIDKDRRIWALGAAAGREVPFENAKGLAEKNWNELAAELRQALADRVVAWVRRA